MEQPQQCNLSDNKRANTTTKINNIRTRSEKRKFAEIVNQKADVSSLVTDFRGSYTRLDTINDDCLRPIFKYLNMMDVVNLVATSTRLLNFAKTDYFPKNATDFTISNGRKTENLETVNLDGQVSSNITLKSLETTFGFFGEFVENLTFSFRFYLIPQRKTETLRSCMVALQHCRNVKKLSFFNCNFNLIQTQALQKQIERFQDLKELKFLNCYGVVEKWPGLLKRVSKVETLHLSKEHPTFDNFFDYFKNLTSLSINFETIYHKWQVHDLGKIFDNIGHCLRHLNLHSLENVQGYQSIATLMTAKLLKLDKLELHFKLTEDTQVLFELPHLKFLDIRCKFWSINSLLRKLSDDQIIEELRISNGRLDFQYIDPLQYSFDNLKSFYCQLTANLSVSNFMEIMTTNSFMPVIHTIELNSITDIGNRNLYNIMEFVLEKKTLKLVELSFASGGFIFPFSWLTTLIDKLNEPCTPKRPFLDLYIFPLELNDKQVSKIARLNILMIIKFICSNSEGDSKCQ